MGMAGAGTCGKIRLTPSPSSTTLFLSIFLVLVLWLCQLVLTWAQSSDLQIKRDKTRIIYTMPELCDVMWWWTWTWSGAIHVFIHVMLDTIRFHCHMRTKRRGEKLDKNHVTPSLHVWKKFGKPYHYNVIKSSSYYYYFLPTLQLEFTVLTTKINSIWFWWQEQQQKVVMRECLTSHII